jgi:hypothetical protein
LATFGHATRTYTMGRRFPAKWDTLRVLSGVPGQYCSVWRALGSDILRGIARGVPVITLPTAAGRSWTVPGVAGWLAGFRKGVARCEDGCRRAAGLGDGCGHTEMA